MKRITVIIILFVYFIFSVLPQAVQEENLDPDLLSDLTSAAFETTQMISANIDTEGEETIYISVSPLKYNNSPSQLGILFGYMLTTRILNSGNDNIAVIPEYSINQYIQQNTDSEVEVSYKVEGSIFRVGDKLYIGIHVIKVSDNSVIAASERVLPLYPEVLNLLSINNSSSGAGGDIYEPNDDPSFATVLIPGETITNLTLNPDEDYDWFQIDLSGFTDDGDANSLVIETQGSLDTYIELYGPDDPYYYISDNDDGGTESNASVTLMIEQPGIYYAKVKGYYFDTTGNYSLVSRFESVIVDESEPNNYLEEAALIDSFETEFVKSFNPSGDEDWYYFNAETMGLEPGNWIIIETLGRMDTLLSVYDDSGYELLYDDDSGTDSNAMVELYINDFGTYYIHVSPYDYGTVGEYRLRISVE